MQEYIADYAGIELAGRKRLINSIFKDAIISKLTDTQVLEILHNALQCSDLTPEEREQIEQILNLK